MPNLKDILENNRKIKSYSDKFGVTNVRIYCDPNTPALQLVVSGKSNSDEQYSSGLVAILLEELGCKISVMVESEIKPLYLRGILKKSVFIDDIDLLEETFKKALDQINIEIFPENDKDATYVRALRLANEILGRKNAPYTESCSTLYENKMNNRSGISISRRP